MASLDDEDVVMENSPLNRYLEEIGEDDYAKYAANKLPKSEQNKIEVQLSIEDDDVIINYLNRLFTKIQKILSLPKMLFNMLLTFLPLPANQVDRTDLLKLCRELTATDLINEVDVRFLTDQEEIVSLLTSNASAKNPRMQGLQSKPYVLLPLFTVIFAIGLQIFLQFENSNIRLASCIAFGMILVGSLCYIISKIWQQELSRQIYELGASFQEVALFLNKLLDKSVQLIKEVEVVSMGMTHYNSNIPFENLEIRSTHSQKCQRLRKILWKFTVLLLKMQSHDTKKLFELILHEIPFDYKEEYIALLPKGSLDEIVNLNEDVDDVIIKLGKCIPLREVKNVVALFRIQQSEFLYRLMITLIYIYKVDDSKGSEHLKSIALILEEQNDRFQFACQKVSDQLEITAKFAFKDEEREKKQHVGTKSNKVHPKNGVHLQKLHITELHLQSAIDQVSKMRLLFDQTTRDEIGPLLQQMTMGFNLNIDNARYCISDLNTEFNPKTKCASNNEEPETAIDLDSQDVSEQSTFVPEAEVGDMMYEGESEPLDTKAKKTNLSPEELEQLAKDSLESMRVMRELKAILSVKTSPEGLLAFPLQKPADEVIDLDKVSTSETTEDASPNYLEHKLVNLDNETNHVIENKTSDTSDESFDKIRPQVFEVQGKVDEIDSNSVKLPAQYGEYSVESNEDHTLTSNADDDTEDVGIVRFGLPKGFAAAIQQRRDVNYQEETFGEIGDSDSDDNDGDDDDSKHE